jgi:UDP-N-acetylglucosamine/UDP-N-acetylgalactosamine 4-epimerase
LETVDFLKQRKKWLVTGAAGFIGSHLIEFLLKQNQIVVGLDNFFNGHQRNIDDVLSQLNENQKASFRFVHGDIRDAKTCMEITQDIDVVLHQAAVGSVPRSIAHPDITFDSNIRGFFEIINACRLNRVQKIVFASSSSVYGDLQSDVRFEEKIGSAISPYAWSKQTNETLAANFRRVYGMDIICLRYFNVFGPRQNPSGDYAAVIPKWILNTLNNKVCDVYGDGLQARDFCYVKNVVQANILAALKNSSSDKNEPWIFNVAYGQQTSLLKLKELINLNLSELGIICSTEINFRESRAGDVRNSLANIDRIKNNLGYDPQFDVAQGLSETARWYQQNKDKYT